MTERHNFFDELTASAGARTHGFWIRISLALILIGVIVFFFGVFGNQPKRAWMAYLINFMFWFGIASGSLMFSAMLVISKAVWGRSLKRLAETPVLFLPVAFVLFWALYFGREHLFPWIHEPVPAKEIWLNIPFFFSRDGAMLLILATFGLLLIYHSVKPDMEAISTGRLPEAAVADTAKHGRRQMVYANIFGLFYAVFLSFLAFDLMMSLDPHWYSSLFGAYYFVASFFTGLCFLMILACISITRDGLDRFIFKKQLHNIGKLMLGFCIMTADFFFVQFFVIWYGNIPEETHYIIERIYQQPWKTLSWAVLIIAFIVPFIVLLSRRVKMIPVFMIGLSIWILVGMWLEKVLVIAPSLWPLPELPIGWIEIGITAGFAGIMGMCILVFLSRFPLLPVGDPVFIKNLEPAYPVSGDSHE